MIKTLYVVQAYQQMTEMGQLMDSTQIETFAESESEAIKKAKKYIKKNHYRISTIMEIDPELKR